MKSIFIALTVALALFGCASPDEIRNNIRQLSDGQLCLQYMTLPTINFVHIYREEEMRNRGLDCWKYGNVAAERAKADAAFQGNNNVTQPQQQIIIQQQFNPAACIQDGGGTFCKR